MKKSLDFAEHEEEAGTVITITLPESSAVTEDDARATFEELIESTDGGEGEASPRNGESVEEDEQRRYERGYQG